MATVKSSPEVNSNLKGSKHFVKCGEQIILGIVAGKRKLPEGEIDGWTDEQLTYL
ncbi:MAG: hypothetical protein ACE5HR_00815 [bacterium]